ncbi:unnamed protein product, partial [Symbiodinium microadriaticum]
MEVPALSAAKPVVELRSSRSAPLPPGVYITASCRHRFCGVLGLAGCCGLKRRSDLVRYGFRQSAGCRRRAASAVGSRESLLELLQQVAPSWQ